MRSIRSFRMTLSLSLVFFAGILHFSSAARAVITVQDYTPWPYRAEIADRYDSVYEFVLMTPPDDALLCEFPPSLVDEIGIHSYPESRAQVGLLVSLGGCSVAQKLRVALEIQAKVSPMVGYLVFYNNNAANPNEIVTLRLSDGLSDGNEFDSLRVVSISTSTGNAILGKMHHWAVVTGGRPEFLSDWNHRWYFPTKVERADGSTDDDKDPSYPRSGAQNFYWFRFVLFSLLIVSPCCRACYLWWAGGGRLRFRYNERGWIVGIQYIPPMSYWFASAGAHEHGRAISDCLTQEQVLALPEISYKTPPASHEDGEAADSVVHEENPEEEFEEVDIIVSYGAADENEPSAKEEDPPEVAASLSNNIELVEEQPVESAPESPPPLPDKYVTSCTTCSICIDDFEEEELIRYLPKCKHAFHTDCIMPWLTERQGCCPLCKTAVLESDELDELEQENQQAGTQHATNAEQESEIIVPPTTEEHQEASETVTPEPELEEEIEPFNASEDERVSLPQSPIESSPIDAQPYSENVPTETQLADDMGSQPKTTESNVAKEDELHPDANQADVPSSTEQPEVPPETHETPGGILTEQHPENQ
jgi:hypothetical protein